MHHWLTPGNPWRKASPGSCKLREGLEVVCCPNFGYDAQVCPASIDPASLVCLYSFPGSSGKRPHIRRISTALQPLRCPPCLAYCGRYLYCDAEWPPISYNLLAVVSRQPCCQQQIAVGNLHPCETMKLAERSFKASNGA